MSIENNNVVEHGDTDDGPNKDVEPYKHGPNEDAIAHTANRPVGFENGTTDVEYHNKETAEATAVNTNDRPRQMNTGTGVEMIHTSFAGQYHSAKRQFSFITHGVKRRTKIIKKPRDTYMGVACNVIFMQISTKSWHKQMWRDLYMYSILCHCFLFFY